VSTSHEPFDTLAELHALSALDGDDLRRFEAHLAAGCARCETALHETQEILARAAIGGPAVAPPDILRATLVRRVAASRRPAPRRWQRWAVGTAAASVAAAVLSGVFVSARYEARLGEMAREQSRVKEALARSEAVLREQAAFYRGAVELLRDPATRVVDLRGQSGAPAAVARMVWHDTNGGLLFAGNLPPAPAGKTYELWTIAGGAPRAAGVFAPDAQGRATVRVPTAPAGTSVQAFAVTLEPEAGVDAPTGPMVLASK
jgi:anti-sigma-K factor RskA